jgi:hypothetical protein
VDAVWCGAVAGHSFFLLGIAFDRDGSFVFVCSPPNLNLHCSLVFQLLCTLDGLNSKGESFYFPISIRPRHILGDLVKIPYAVPHFSITYSMQHQQFDILIAAFLSFLAWRP